MVDRQQVGGWLSRNRNVLAWCAMLVVVAVLYASVTVLALRHDRETAKEAFQYACEEANNFRVDDAETDDAIADLLDYLRGLVQIDPDAADLVAQIDVTTVRLRADRPLIDCRYPPQDPVVPPSPTSGSTP